MEWLTKLIVNVATFKFGETGRTLEARMKEHKQTVRLVIQKWHCSDYIIIHYALHHKTLHHKTLHHSLCTTTYTKFCQLYEH